MILSFDWSQPRNITLLSFTVLTVFLSILSRFLRVKHDPQEPPLIPPKIPYIGHLIGFLRHGNDYTQVLNEKRHLPIYSLVVLNQKTYVVNSPDLIIGVQKNTKSLSFGPLAIEVSKRMLNVPDEAYDCIKRNQFGDEPGRSYMAELHAAQYGILAPGPALDQMNVDMLTRMLPFINDLKNNQEPVSLLPHFRHVFTIAGTYALLGSSSPFEDNPPLEKAFWDFTEDAGLLIMNIIPRLTSPKGHAGRAKLTKALQDYYRVGGLQTASKLLQERHRIAAAAGMTLDHMAHTDAGLMFGLLINAVPSVFWLTCYICADASLLADIRLELLGLISRPDEATARGAQILELDVSQFRQRCPVFCSTYQEVLRLISSHSTGRMVVKDTRLNDRYLLKEGAIVQMPGASVHFDTTIWGADARAFQPRRFINSKVPAVAFRAYGGGATMCPGRWLAFTGITSLAAVLVLGFEIVSVEGDWKLPRQENARMPLGVAQPQESIEVLIRPAEAFRDVEWRFVGGEAATM